MTPSLFLRFVCAAFSADSEESQDEPRAGSDPPGHNNDLTDVELQALLAEFDLLDDGVTADGHEV